MRLTPQQGALQRAVIARIAARGYLRVCTDSGLHWIDRTAGERLEHALDSFVPERDGLGRWFVAANVFGSEVRIRLDTITSTVDVTPAALAMEEALDDLGTDDDGDDEEELAL